MIIVVGNWKRKVARLVLLVVVIGIFAAAVPVLTGKFYDRTPVSGWFKDEHPSGNPMRVEQKKEVNDKSVGSTKFDQTMDQFVIKLQDFYYEE
ncbi:MAG: hypothetical protein GXY34_02545 [Syntrophomonadaceae bacterium]|nr:hypothetical protein [Syntrophomonadaceae bacterium]